MIAGIRISRKPFSFPGDGGLHIATLRYQPTGQFFIYLLTLEGTVDIRAVTEHPARGDNESLDDWTRPAEPVMSKPIELYLASAGT